MMVFAFNIVFNITPFAS